MRRGRNPGLVAAAVLLPFSLLRAAPGADWPVFRHDVALSGVSPGKGKILHPRIIAERYLGAPAVDIAGDREPAPADVADLDGDGRPERFTLSGKTITVSSLEGRTLWTHTVDGEPLGGNVRAAKLFPERKGLQVISFSSRMDTGAGQGYCFSFLEGAEKGQLAWTTGPLTGQYAPTLIVADVDGDGLVEVLAVGGDGVLRVIGEQ